MITNVAKQRMLKQLDVNNSDNGQGINAVILLRRSDDGESEVQYTTDGQYGGIQTISWDSTIVDTLEQDGNVTFDVEQGKRIVGYILIYDDGTTTTYNTVVLTNEYVFIEDGTFTITNVKITFGW